MRYGQFDESVVIDYLKSHAELNAFYVFNVDSSRPGLIHYFDSEGEPWCLMEDNDDLVSACLSYLSDQGAPVFNNADEIKVFEENYKNKINGINGARLD
jgi:hypothetical protein